MGRSLILGLLLLITVSCGDNASEDLASNTVVCGSGLIGNIPNCQPMLAGMCKSETDCPEPYNSCDSNNRCAIVFASDSDLRTWFATDLIRPGVTRNCNGNGCPSQTDYIYNIMAKGYASLDDWCMSQAQQSTIPAMRNIASWKALIVAQPDNQTSLSSIGLSRQKFYTNLVAGYTFSQPNAIANYVGINQAIPFSVSNNFVYDKDGTPVALQQGAWSGVNRSFCQYLADSACQPSTLDSVGSCNCSVGDIACNTCCPYSTQCGDCTATGGNTEECDVTYQTFQPSTLVANSLCQTNSNSWASSQAINNSGSVFILTPQNCKNGFDFATDCNGGISQYNANGSTQKPILCLANEQNNP